MITTTITQAKYRLKNAGFVALISVVIISAILLLVATTLSFGGFFGRFNILESEYKERSIALADACVDTALLRTAQGVTITGTVTVSGNDTCIIKTATTVGSQTTFNIQANYQSSYTNLRVTIETADLSVLSWIEIPTLP